MSKLEGTARAMEQRTRTRRRRQPHHGGAPFSPSAKNDGGHQDAPQEMFWVSDLRNEGNEASRNYYSAEKSPIIASAREEVTFDSKNNFGESLSNNHRLSLVLSVKNHPEICGNHNQSCDSQLLEKVFFCLEFNRGVVRNRAFTNNVIAILEKWRIRNDC